MTEENRTYITQLKVTDVPWHRLTTAYGRGTDFPAHLAVLERMEDEEYLWSEEYDEEEDEMRYEEDEVFPADLFYSFYYYSWQAVLAYRSVLEQAPAEFAEPAAAVLERL